MNMLSEMRLHVWQLDNWIFIFTGQYAVQYLLNFTELNPCLNIFHTPHNVILQHLITYVCYTYWCFLFPYSTINKGNCTENNLDYLENRVHHLSREICLNLLSLILNFPIKSSITVTSFDQLDSDILGHIIILLI